MDSFFSTSLLLHVLIGSMVKRQGFMVNQTRVRNPGLLAVWPGDYHLISSYLGLLICKVGGILVRILVRTGNTVCVTPSTQPCPQNSSKYHGCCPGEEAVCSGWICSWAASCESGTAACGRGQESSAVELLLGGGVQDGNGQKSTIFFGHLEGTLASRWFFLHIPTSIQQFVAQLFSVIMWIRENMNILKRVNIYVWFYPLEVRFHLKGYEAT